jgi:hypothetical protein
MRDHTSGPRWDHRSLRDLTYCRVRVVCKVCRHVAYLNPKGLERYQSPRWNWQLIIPRLRCTDCGMSQANATAEPLPRD